MSAKCIDSMIEKLKHVEQKVFKIKGSENYFRGSENYFKIQCGLLKSRSIAAGDDGRFSWWASTEYFNLFFTKEIEICEDIDYETGQPKPKPVDFATALRDMVDNPNARYEIEGKDKRFVFAVEKTRFYWESKDYSLTSFKVEIQLNEALSEKWVKVK